MGSCVLCKSGAVINRQDSASRTIYNCPNCGVFVVSDLVEKEVRKNTNAISSFLMSRKIGDQDDIVLISFEKANLDKGYLQLTVEQIVDQFPENFSEKMDMTLLNLAKQSQFEGAQVKVDDLKVAPLFYVKRTNFDALSFVIKSMQKAELIDVTYYSGAFFPCTIIISPAGWNRIAELKKGAPRRASIYVSAIRGEHEIGDQFRKASRKVAKECGLHITDNSSAGSEAKIGNGIAANVRSSKIVISDLTEQNAESYYTAALAEGLGKICILTCHESTAKNLQIDTGQRVVHIWKNQDSLQLELFNAIKAQM